VFVLGTTRTAFPESGGPVPGLQPRTRRPLSHPESAAPVRQANPGRPGSASLIRSHAVDVDGDLAEDRLGSGVDGSRGTQADRGMVVMLVAGEAAEGRS